MEIKDLKELIKGDFYTLVTKQHTWIIQFDHQDWSYIYRTLSTNDEGAYNYREIRALCKISDIRSIRKATEKEINYLVKIALQSNGSDDLYKKYFTNVELVFKTYI